MGVTLTGIVRIKESQTKWVEMLEECLRRSEGQVHWRKKRERDHLWNTQARQSGLITRAVFCELKGQPDSINKIDVCCAFFFFYYFIYLFVCFFCSFWRKDKIEITLLGRKTRGRRSSRDRGNTLVLKLPWIEISFSLLPYFHVDFPHFFFFSFFERRGHFKAGLSHLSHTAAQFPTLFYFKAGARELFTK